MVAKKDMPLLQHACATSPTASSTSSYCSRPRLASEELIVPASDTASSVYYGVDAFSPTLVDFYTADQKRIVWSSRAHRKMMTTLYRAWHGKCWKLFSFSFWGSLCAIFAYTLFLIGFIGEAMAHGASSGSTAPASVHALVDIPLFVAAVCYFAWHVVSYFEVINSCHNLEIWLDEYFHGTEPVLERRFFGFFPTRIDFWTAVLGILGSSLYVFARAFIMLRADQKNYGVIDIQRDNLSLIVGYWLPFFAGSFLLLTSAYLAHVEVIHQWISCRLTTLETWVTGALMLSIVLYRSSSYTLCLMLSCQVSTCWPSRASSRRRPCSSWTRSRCSSRSRRAWCPSASAAFSASAQASSASPSWETSTSDTTTPSTASGRRPPATAPTSEAANREVGRLLCRELERIRRHRRQDEKNRKVFDGSSDPLDNKYPVYFISDMAFIRSNGCLLGGGGAGCRDLQHAAL